ncbi:MAG: hypothetical protein RR357_05350 [Clostridia bacterium]
MKTWIKSYVDDKIVKSIIINRKTHLNRALFDDIIREACYEFDFSTPVILPSHFNHFLEFNVVKFLPRDFIEPVNFDWLVVEICNS